MNFERDSELTISTILQYRKRRSNFYRDIHITIKSEDKKCVKESAEVSLGGQGGEEEADEGDAAASRQPYP